MLLLDLNLNRNPAKIETELTLLISICFGIYQVATTETLIDKTLVKAPSCIEALGLAEVCANMPEV
jgi:hypothetical protein